MRYKITDIPNIRDLGVGKEKPLDELTKKEVLSFLDYAIILSTMYARIVTGKQMKLYKLRMSRLLI